MLTEIFEFSEVSVADATPITGLSDGVAVIASSVGTAGATVMDLLACGCVVATACVPIVIVWGVGRAMAISPALIALSDWIWGSGTNLLI